MKLNRSFSELKYNENDVNNHRLNNYKSSDGILNFPKYSIESNDNSGERRNFKKTSEIRNSSMVSRDRTSRYQDINKDIENEKINKPNLVTSNILMNQRFRSLDSESLNISNQDLENNFDRGNKPNYDKKNNLKRTVSAQKTMVCVCGASTYYERERLLLKQEKKTLKEKEISLNNAFNRVSQLQNQVDQELDELCRSKTILENQVSNLKKDKEAFQLKKEELKKIDKRLFEFETHILKVQEKADKKIKAIDAREHELDIIEAEIANEREELENEKNMYISDLQDKKNAIEAEKEKLTYMTNKLHKEKELFHQSSKKKENLIEETKHKLDLKREELNKFEHDLNVREENLNLQINDFNISKEKIESVLKEQENFIESEKQKLHESQRIFKINCDIENEKLISAKAQLKEEEENLTAQRKEIQNEKNHLVSKREEYNIQVEKFNIRLKQMTSAEEQLYVTKEELSKKEKDLNDQQIFIDQMRNIMEEQKKQLEQQEKMLKTEKADFERIKIEESTQNESLNLERKALKSEIAHLETLREDLNKQQNLIDEMKQSLDQKEKNLEQKANDFAVVCTENLKIEKQKLNRKESELASIFEKIQSQRELLNYQNAEIKKRADDLRSKSEYLEKFKEELEEKKRILDWEFESLQETKVNIDKRGRNYRQYSERPMRTVNPPRLLSKSSKDFNHCKNLSVSLYGGKYDQNTKGLFTPAQSSKKNFHENSRKITSSGSTENEGLVKTLSKTIGNTITNTITSTFNNTFGKKSNKPDESNKTGALNDKHTDMKKNFNDNHENKSNFDLEKNRLAKHNSPDLVDNEGQFDHSENEETYEDNPKPFGYYHDSLTESEGYRGNDQINYNLDVLENKVIEFKHNSKLLALNPEYYEKKKNFFLDDYESDSPNSNKLSHENTQRGDVYLAENKSEEEFIVHTSRSMLYSDQNSVESIQPTDFIIFNNDSAENHQTANKNPTAIKIEQIAEQCKKDCLDDSWNLEFAFGKQLLEKPDTNPLLNEQEKNKIYEEYKFNQPNTNFLDCED